MFHNEWRIWIVGEWVLVLVSETLACSDDL